MSPPDPWLLCDPYCAQFKCYHEEEIEMNEEPPVTEAELARAIEHAEKVASEAQGRCSQEHAQLAKWLRELAAARAAIKVATEALLAVKPHIDNELLSRGLGGVLLHGTAIQTAANLMEAALAQLKVVPLETVKSLEAHQSARIAELERRVEEAERERAKLNIAMSALESISVFEENMHGEGPAIEALAKIYKL